MKHAGEQELFEILRDVADHFDGENLKGTGVMLYVFGGAAAVIAYGSRRGTADIDVYLEDARVKEKLLAWAGKGTELAQKHGIYFSGVNTTLMPIESPDWRGRCVEILKDRLMHIRVMALGKEDLILSKLSRYNDRDREDIQFIAEKHKVDAKKLIGYYKAARRYFVGNIAALDQTFDIVLEENFGHKPLEFDPNRSASAPPTAASPLKTAGSLGVAEVFGRKMEALGGPSVGA